MRRNMSVLTFDGQSELLVWKHPENVFDVKTVVIVPFSHEAIFVEEGNIVATLKSGKTLLYSPELGLFKDKKQKQHCALYFVNMTVNQKILWGTPRPMDMFDLKLKLPVQVGVSGEMEVRIFNPRKFLAKTVGTRQEISPAYLEELLQSKVLLCVKDIIAKKLLICSYYELSSRLLELSRELKASLSEELSVYGITCESVTVGSIVLPDDLKKELENFRLCSLKLENQPKSCVCNYCGATLVDGAKFCFICGKPTTNVSFETPKKETNYSQTDKTIFSKESAFVPPLPTERKTQETENTERNNGLAEDE